MASSSLDPRHSSNNSQHNHKSAIPIQKTLSASKGSKRLEDNNMGNKSSLGFNGLDCDRAHSSVERIQWDLNVPMEQWDVVVSGRHNMDNKSSCGVMHEQKTEGCFGSDLTSRTSILKKSRLATDGKKDYEGSLELQLSPPCRPDLHIRWGNKSPPDLTLGFPGTHSVVSCSPKCSKGMETETAHCNISKSVDTDDVKSEQCDGSFQVETSKEFEECLANTDLDNQTWTSCCSKSTPGKVIPSVTNEEALPADMLPNYDSTKLGDAKIVQDKLFVIQSCAVVAEDSKPGGPELHCVTENSCEDEEKGMLGTSEGSADMECSDNEYYYSREMAVDIRADYVKTSAPQVASSTGNEQPQGAQESQSGRQYKISVAQCDPIDDEEGKPGDPEPMPELKRMHGMSEGSAEMDCSDNECYSSHNKKGIHGNVVTDAIGLDDQPATGLYRVTKENLKVLEGVRIGEIADNFDNNACLDKKETSCKTTMLADTRMEEASSVRKLTKPSQETSEKHPRKKTSNVKPKFARPQIAIAKNETSAAIPPVNIRDSDASINHPEPPERGFDVNVLKSKKTHDKVQQSDQINKVLSPNLTSSGQREPVTARSVRTEYKQDQCDYPQKRDWSCFRGRRHPNYYARNNYDKHAPSYVHTRRGRKPHFHTSAHHRTEADDSRRHYAPRHYKEFQIPPKMQQMNDQLNRPSHFPNRRLPENLPDVPICTSSNGSRAIGKEVHVNLQLDHDEIMAVDNSMYQHSGEPPPALEVDCFHEDVTVAGNGRPPYSQLPSENTIRSHPMNDSESRRPGAFLEGNAGHAEHLGPAHYVEHLQEGIHPCAAARDNGGYRPDHFRTDSEAFPRRGSFRPFAHNNFGHKRRKL